MSKEVILKIITDFYLESRDFNGIPATNLCEKLDKDWQALEAYIISLIEDDLVGILFSNTHVNTHVIRVGFEPKEKQISKIKTNDLYHTCLYPLSKHLREKVDNNTYKDKPYKLELALGSYKLDFRSFDLSVLEIYRNDPRYYYTNNDMKGKICIKDEYFESNNIPESDQILLNGFGFSYSKDNKRALAVFLTDLYSLSSEHQKIWKAKELKEEYKLHPGYYKSQILGQMPENISVCTAILKEIYIINQMAAAMNREPLFRNDFGKYGDDKPKKFELLIRPTLEEFNNFIHLLDKMFSENLNRSFFQKDVSYKTEIERNDGKVEVRHKGTINILDDWVRKCFYTESWEHWEKVIELFKEVRSKRQKPAHSINENEFDEKYIKEQRNILEKAYSSLKSIRLLFSSHPHVKKAEINIPNVIKESKIWTM